MTFAYVHIFQDILRDFAYKLCKSMTIMFDASLKTVTRKSTQDIKIIDATAGTGLIGLELHQMGYTNLHALDSKKEGDLNTVLLPSNRRSADFRDKHRRL